MSSIYGGVSLHSTDGEEGSDCWSGSDDIDDSSLYDDFKKLELNEAVYKSTKVLALSGPRVYALNPYEIAKIIEYDSKIESEFFSNISSLHSLLYVCDKAITIFHSVNSKSFRRSEAHIPPTTGLEVIPSALSKGDSGQNQNADTTQRNQETVERFLHFKLVRFVISYFVICIRELGNDILRAVDRLESSRGRDGLDVKAIILNALKTNLDKCGEQVEKLEANLKCVFQRDYLKQIQIDLMWDTIDESTSKTLEELDSLEKKQKEHHQAIKCQQGKLINYNNLICATQKHLPHSHSNVEAKESRLKVLGETIATTKENIVEVPASASSSEYLQWLHWWVTREKCEMNENIKGTEEVEYYDSLVYVRTKTKAKSAPGGRTDKKRNETMMKDLRELYNVYNSKFKKTKVELGNMTGTFKSTMGKYQFKIGGLIKKLPKMLETDWMLLSSIGCIETYVKSIENRTGKDGSAFYPFFAILNGIEALVTTDVELLTCEDREDIFVGGKRLKKDAAFILNFADNLMYL